MNSTTTTAREEERAARIKNRVSARLNKRVSLALVEDPRPKDTYERRVWNCTHLDACETAWIEAHAKTNIATAAACPPGCPGAPR